MNTCDICGNELVGINGHKSIDIWLLRTQYDGEGEVTATMETVYGINDDYLVIGSCCQHKVKVAWEALIKQLGIVRKE